MILNHFEAKVKTSSPINCKPKSKQNASPKASNKSNNAANRGVVTIKLNQKHEKHARSSSPKAVRATPGKARKPCSPPHRVRNHRAYEGEKDKDELNEKGVEKVLGKQRKANRELWEAAENGNVEKIRRLLSW